MNRREFTKSLAAAFVVPAIPLKAVAAAQPVNVTNAARFWAIYMTRLHGDVTPGMLTQMTGLDPVQTTAIRSKLVAENVISPTGFIRKGITSQTVLRPEGTSQNTLTDLKDRVLSALEEEDEVADETQELTEPESVPIDPEPDEI